MLFKLSGDLSNKQTNTWSKWVCFVCVPSRYLSWNRPFSCSVWTRFILDLLKSTLVSPLCFVGTSPSFCLFGGTIHPFKYAETVGEKVHLQSIYRSENYFISFHTIFLVLIFGIIVSKSSKSLSNVKLSIYFQCLSVGFFKLIEYWSLFHFMQSKILPALGLIGLLFWFLPK